MKNGDKISLDVLLYYYTFPRCHRSIKSSPSFSFWEILFSFMPLFGVLFSCAILRFLIPTSLCATQYRSRIFLGRGWWYFLLQYFMRSTRHFSAASSLLSSCMRRP